MSDRIKGLIVSLDQDYRDDDVQPIMDAIRMVKGVADVATSVATPEDWMARSRLRSDVHTKLYKAIDEALKDVR